MLTRKGKPAVTCGTFNVAQEGTTTFRMIAAYDLDRFDGWAITEWDAQTRSERVVMQETRLFAESLDFRPGSRAPLRARGGTREMVPRPRSVSAERAKPVRRRKDYGAVRSLATKART